MFETVQRDWANALELDRNGFFYSYTPLAKFLPKLCSISSKYVSVSSKVSCNKVS